MKKIIFSSVLAMLLTFNASAVENPTFILNSFHSDFSGASDVAWTIKSNFIEISFNQQNESQNAYYDFEGRLLGTSRVIALDKLSAKVKAKLATKYADLTVGRVIEFTIGNESSYYIYASNETTNVVLKAGISSVQRFKKL